MEEDIPRNFQIEIIDRLSQNIQTKNLDECYKGLMIAIVFLNLGSPANDPALYTSQVTRLNHHF